MLISNFNQFCFKKSLKSIILKCFKEECKYVVKEKKMPKYITDDAEISPDSDEENFNEENSDK